LSSCDDPSSLDWVEDLWNETASMLGLSPIRKLNSQRKSVIKSRIAEYSKDDLRAVLESPKDCEFLRGENDRGWSAQFDWLLKPANFVKVLEGNYADTKPKKEISEREQQILADLEEAGL